MKKEKEKTIGIFIKVNKDEEEIIKKLRSKYAINISRLIRNTLINYFNKLENTK